MIEIINIRRTFTERTVDDKLLAVEKNNSDSVTGFLHRLFYRFKITMTLNIKLIGLNIYASHELSQQSDIPLHVYLFICIVYIS